MKIFKILISIIILFAGGIAMAYENLNINQQNIVMISSYTSTGDMENLELSIKKGLNEGLTINEVKEIIVQLYAYCGFPRSLNVISALLKISKD